MSLPDSLFAHMCATNRVLSAMYRQPRPARLVCAHCASDRVERGEITVCNWCGKQTDFRPVTPGPDWTEEEIDIGQVQCIRCGTQGSRDDGHVDTFAGYCEDCGHVAEPVREERD